MTNKKISSIIQITKIDEDENKLSNVKFGIYDINDNLISEHTTDENGYIEIKLDYGKYYLKEISGLDNYVLSDKKIYFEVVEDGTIIKNTIINKFKVGTLEFTKIDISTNNTLPNTLIEIYTEKDELIFSGRTDEHGKVIIENLRYGKYYIIEKEAPEGYVLNDEKMYFEILEDGEVIKSSMPNEKVKVPSTGLSNINWEQIGYISLIITGMGFIVYGITKKKK